MDWTLEQLRREHTCPSCSGALIEGAPYDPAEPCRNCGYAIGVHRMLEPCPTEIEAYQRWGLM